MDNHYFFSSVTRIADLDTHPFQVVPQPREIWATGDYVVGEVIPPLTNPAKVELRDGRLADVLEGDRLVGAFGIRQATLEAVGDWQSIPADGRMDHLTCAGLFGRLTSQSFLLPALTHLQYIGHVVRQDLKVTMKDFVPPIIPISYQCPTIMMIGTSMSAGKTTAARIIIHELKKFGLRVVGAKLTGASRYRDILSMRDAGADHIFDFVDVGLPSSICPEAEFRYSLRQLLTMISSTQPDVVVLEAGASPFEPYNGSIVLDEIKAQICFVVLCASDPYAVVGVIKGFDVVPDLISGVTTNTTAARELVEKLTGVRALSLIDDSNQWELRELLKKKVLGFCRFSR